MVGDVPRVLSTLSVVFFPAGKKYLRSKEAGKYLGLSHKTLDKWRVSGRGPQFHKIGGKIRYVLDDLEEFAAKSVYPHTSACGLRA